MTAFIGEEGAALVEEAVVAEEGAAAVETASQLFSETGGLVGEVGGVASDGFSIDFGNASIDDSGDGSDDDLDEAAQEAADEAKDLLRTFNSNPGMDALADLIDDAIDEQAGGMADGVRPNIDALYAAISGVHSGGTAQSCMTEGVQAAHELLMEAYQAMKAHEQQEGVGFGD